MRISDTNYKCYPGFEKVGVGLHIFSLFLVVIGTVYSLIESYQHKHSMWLTLSLVIFFLCKLPDQICTVLKNKKGWLSLTGTIITLISLTLSTIFIALNRNHDDNIKNKPIPAKPAT